MKTSINSIRPVHITCYAIGFICLITLFFTNKWEPGFFELIKHHPLFIEWGLTVNKLTLFLLNASMFISIVSPLKNEDERLQKIKNYVFIHTFIAALGMGIVLGLIMKTSTGLLIYTTITQAYYILIFQICLYRDSLMVYMDKEQLKTYNLEINKRFKTAFVYTGLSAVIMNILILNNRFDLTAIAIAGCSFLFFLIRSVYMHWQN